MENDNAADLPADFDVLPPEMVTGILEFLEDCPPSVLACRLVSRRFKVLIDDILEKRHFSLWNWEKCTGEAKAVAVPGPLKRAKPTGRHFQKASEIDQFLKDMEDHKALDLNPFPHRGVYFRRVRGNPLFSQTPGGNTEEEEEGGNTVQEAKARSLQFFQQDLAGDNGPLPVSKILTLLDTFGEHLTSLILECGATTDLVSVTVLQDILQKVPNLQCLLLKGVNILKNSTDDPDLQLPPLKHLKSLKIIYCTGLTTPFLRSYHRQLESLQLLNSRDFWLLHLERLHLENLGVRIFSVCKELKLGELSSPQEFDYLHQFLRDVQDNPQSRSLHRLERLSLRSASFPNLEEHTGKIFQLLEHLPLLKDFHLGKHGDDVGIDDNLPPGDNPGGIPDSIKFPCASPVLTRVSLPFKLLQYPRLLRSIFQSIRPLQKVRLYRYSSPAEPTSDEEGGESRPLKDTSMAMDGWLEEFPRLSRLSLVNWFGDREQVLLTRCNQKP